jgi:beta-glucosidase
MLQNRLFTDPILLGTYPAGADMLTTADIDSIVLDGDLQVISAPLDAWGVNYYNPTSVGAAGPGDPFPFAIKPLESYPKTEFGWPVVPEGLRQTLVMLHERYPKLPPIWITENGCSYAAIDDADRIAYLDGHLGAVRAAVEEGVDVAGYCVWSLLDNFEWAEGYQQRFGLVHVDFETQQRTKRSSFGWYQSAIAAGK